MQKFTLFLSLLGVLFLSPLHAQVPQRFNYQGIARDAKGNPLAGQALSLKISLLPTADAPEAEYEEIQTVSTNAFGLYTLQIGNGSPTKGEMKAVKWESGNKYIRVAIDPKGGSDFVDAGTTQLLSVPYALYADRAGLAKSGGDRTGAVSSNAAHVAGDANYLTKFTALNVIGKSQIFDNGTNVGIGTNAPASTASLHIRRSTAGQYLYLENPTATSSGSFRLYNDVATNFATFTKYGSAVTGGYTGIADKYPYANILGFGNNGAVLNASTGNIGLAITKAGTNKLKFHIDAATERLGLGGNATPAAPVHFNNTNGSNDTLKFTNQTTGHTAADGLEIRTTGNAARIINRENDALVLGTNNTDRLAISSGGNVGIGTSTPHPSALAEMSSVNQGFLPPRMSTMQRNAISAPATGLVIFNTTSNCLNFYIGTAWNELCGTTASGQGPVYPAGTVFCSGNPTAVVDVINPVTGITWMDRNLGASQVANNATDSLAYGDLYQWGRGADGHQCRNSATTSSLSTSDQPGNGNFILSTAQSLYDWRSPQNANLWQGLAGVNNPCPSGYRLPTAPELDAERMSWSSNNALGAFNSVLKLPNAGNRTVGGQLVNVGISGTYWSSTTINSGSQLVFFTSSNASLNGTDRAGALSVRCLKN